MIYTPHPDLSSTPPEPINGRYITPQDYDDYCLNCAQPLKLAPVAKIEDRYWFHVISGERNCLGKDLNDRP